MLGVGVPQDIWAIKSVLLWIQGVFVTMARNLFPRIALFAVPIGAALFPDCQNGPLAGNTVCDTSAPVADRARAFVNELTLEEKFNLTGDDSPGVPRLGVYP
jgi:hypothetical protein